MNVTSDDDDQQQLHLFESLPPLSTLAFGCVALFTSIILTMRTVRRHTKRYLQPVKTLQAALASGEVVHSTATITACNTYDPFLNLSFPTTHLLRKVSTYAFIKSTYREYYLFNKRATNAEKALMATKEGNGDSRVRVHWTVGWIDGAGEDGDVVVPATHTITTSSPIQLSDSTQIIPDSLTPPPPAFTPIPQSMLPPHPKFNPTPSGYTTSLSSPRIGDILVSYQVGYVVSSPITVLSSPFSPSPPSPSHFSISPSESSPLLHTRPSINTAITSALSLPLGSSRPFSSSSYGQTSHTDIGSYNLPNLSGILILPGTHTSAACLRIKYKRKGRKWWNTIILSVLLSVLGSLSVVGILRESVEDDDDGGYGRVEDGIGRVFVDYPMFTSVYLAVGAVAVGFTLGQVTFCGCVGGWVGLVLLAGVGIFGLNLVN
ncbi:hypothetical protein TrVE_jg14122 [Triparma verrucosa]|uniref:Uncharacterized protein n=1 Tax=Triparma verrucosa TaxID=1606542 RepID=A0A9W7BTT0_9STRA|nr:hypothetical protein TrVE_jg14122 [Triparma verrucosa]